MSLQFSDISTGKLRYVSQDKNKEQMSPKDYYDYIVNRDFNLNEIKEAKINLLKDECSQAIYDGFISESTGYSFGFNQLDQINFTQQMLLIVSDTNNITTIQWKTKNQGVVELTKEQFIQVVEEAKQHKLNQQQKYWNLEQQVLNATDKDTVKSIVW